jgi:GH25 family lysozyme M1 (1,4-beta-N-acetylmuramidase)
MKPLLFAVSAFVACSGALASRGTAQQAGPCCSITAIDAQTGVVSARDDATNQTFQFIGPQPRFAARLRVGLPVYADFTSGHVSVNGRTECCTIVSGVSSQALAAAAPVASLPAAVGGFPAVAPQSVSATTTSLPIRAAAPTLTASPSCAGTKTLRGVDVSRYQGTVNWSMAKTSGLAFAYASVGTGTAPDPTFAANYSGIRDARLLRGAYQVFDPLADAGQQATAALAAIGKIGPRDLPLALDLAPAVEAVAGHQLSAETFVSRVNVWIDQVKAATGVSPVLLNPSPMPSGLSGFAPHALWIAQFGAQCPTLPAGTQPWAFWVYSSSGTVPGIVSTVDLDVFNGTVATLRSLGR